MNFEIVKLKKRFSPYTYSELEWKLNEVNNFIVHYDDSDIYDFNVLGKIKISFLFLLLRNR
jgi:hypothetical protein